MQPLTKKTIEEVKSEMVSVIIVARNEEYLSKTVKNMHDMAEGPVEFIVIMDGPSRFGLENKDSTVFMFNNMQSIGRRPATNLAVSHAHGKYLFHIDAHCKTDCKGWDTILKQSCTDKRTMVIPSLDKLIVPKFICKKKSMGHKYIDIRFKDQWSNIKPKEPLEYTITGNGMGWFLEKDYYKAFGGCCKLQPDIWGNFGVEWAMKIWLSDPYGEGIPGKVLLSKEVVFAHMWKPKTGYNTPGVVNGRKALFRWVRGEGENQCRSFSFFETELSHLIPKKIKHSHKLPLTINSMPIEILELTDKPEVTAIMNTNGLYGHLDAEAIESFIRQDYKHKRLIIVTTCPAYQLDKEYSNIEVVHIKPFARFPQQIQHAINLVKTPLWCVMDSDDIFKSNHISSLVNLYKRAKKEGLESPGYVINNQAWEQVKNNWPKLRHRGWWSCMFEKIDSNFVNDNFNKFLQGHKDDTGSDLHFIKDPELNWVKYENEPPTVLHRLGIGFHIRKESKIKDYYKKSIDRVLEFNPGIIIPQYQRDYDAMFDLYENPPITLIMNTFQRDSESLQLAVNAFCNNTYQNKKLLIVNSNIKPLFIYGYHPDIDVVNIESINHIQEFKEALKYVATPFVGILDDDDLIKENHISQLAQMLRENKFKNVINTVFYNRNMTTGKNNIECKKMWWNGVYRTANIKAVNVGEDLRAFDKRYMKALDPIEVKLEPTYIWQRGHVDQESKTLENSHSDKLQRIEAAKQKAVNVTPIELNYLLPENPEITVVMVTYGAHKEQTEQAINSFLNQDYRAKNLLILNTHPDPIIFKGNYDNIKVVEMPGYRFNTLAEKYKHIIKQVDTPLWCILDDDDIVLSSHLKTLAQTYCHTKASYNKKHNKRPVCVGHQRKIIMMGKSIDHVKHGAGWSCRGYEKLTDDKLEAKFNKQLKGTTDCDYDYRFTKSEWHKYIINYPFLPTYIWRGGGDTFHLSAAGNTKEVFDQAFLGAELKAYKNKNAGVWYVENKRINYEKLFNIFLNTATEKQMFWKQKQYIKLGTSGTMGIGDFNFVVDFLKQKGVNRFVEIGCGASTLAYNALGYDVTSYETETKWANRIRGLLDKDCIILYPKSIIPEIVKDVDFVMIDGPDPNRMRENSFIAASKAKIKYIGSHDIHRPLEQKFIQKHLIENGYKKICQHPTDLKKKCCGVAIYERQ